jgi:hypothetical protein
MTKSSILVVVVCLLGSLLTAQNPLSTAIRTYNQLHQRADTLTERTATDADLAAVVSAGNAATTLLDSFLMVTKGPDADVARYFRGITRAEQARVFGLRGQKAAAIDRYRLADADLTDFNQDRFPLDYTLDSVEYRVQHSHFAPIGASVALALSNDFYQQKNYAAALPYARKALASEGVEELERIETQLKIVRMLLAEGTADTELRDMAISALDNFYSFNTDYRAKLARQFPDINALCLEAVEKAVAANPDFSDNGGIWAEMSRLMLKNNDKTEALRLAERAVKDGCTDREFLLATIPLAHESKNNLLAHTAADRYAESVSPQECGLMAVAADNYDLIGHREKADGYRKGSQRCLQALQRTVRKVERDPGLYVGAYLLPLIRTDWGAVAALQTRRHIFEVSYQQLTDRRDKRYDLRLRGVDGASDVSARWDGYYTHLAVSRLSGKPGRRLYNGLLFGYNLREFQEIIEPRITNDAGEQINTGDVIFKPREERYILMMNTGTHNYGRILCSDIFLSFGGAWCQFDPGNDAYNRDVYNFSNALTNGRRSGRFVLMARFGITVGLHVGRKTFGRK